MSSNIIRMNIESNLGYSADQIGSPMSLSDLLAAVEDAIENYGEDAQVVLHQVNNRYGANFGELYAGQLFDSDDNDW